MTFETFQKSVVTVIALAVLIGIGSIWRSGKKAVAIAHLPAFIWALSLNRNRNRPQQEEPKVRRRSASPSYIPPPRVPRIPKGKFKL